jgi:uncharacterized protein DUF5946
MRVRMLEPCEGCGALFPPYDGPTHRYLGASAACWAVFHWHVLVGEAEATDLLQRSRVPEQSAAIPARDDAALGALFGDAYGVQHHGDESAQAIQSVAVHLLDIHAIVTGRTTQPGWGLGRAIRKRGVFHKLTPPPLGSALTIRHLFLGGGVATPITRAQYVASVYEAWMSLHRRTVEEWYDRYVAPDDMR